MGENKASSQYKTFTIDGSFQKLDQPISVLSPQVTAYLGTGELVFDVAAPGALIFSSSNQDIINVKKEYGNTYVITPKKEGDATLNIQANETELNNAATRQISVTVKKNVAEVYFGEDNVDKGASNYIFKGIVYVSKTNGRHETPTGSVHFNVLGDDKTLLNSDVEVVLTDGYARYELTVPRGNTNYKVTATYSGDENYGTI